MNVVIVNHNGGSPRHGPNLRTYYAARNLVAQGHKVVIVSSSFSHKYVVKPVFDGQLGSELIDGIDYKWIKISPYKNILQRIYSHFYFSFKLIKYNKRIFPSQVDCLIFSGPPPEIFFSCWFLSFKYKCKLISDIRDLWPRVQLDMSKAYWLNPYIYFLYFSQFFIFRFSDKITSPLPCINRYVKHESIKKRIAVIENGYDLDLLPPKKDLFLDVLSPAKGFSVVNGRISTHDIRESDYFIVGYSGSFDRDNDADSLMTAAKTCANKKVIFVFVGSGVRLNHLLEESEKLPNVMICGRVPSEDVLNVLDSFDVCYCGLKHKAINQYGVALAKTFEYMAAAKPIIWMIDGCNNPVADGGGGVTVEPGRVDKLVDAINKLSEADTSEIAHMGKCSYEYLVSNNSYAVLGNKWLSIID